jgi:hypothetical protein
MAFFSILCAAFLSQADQGIALLNVDSVQDPSLPSRTTMLNMGIRDYKLSFSPFLCFLLDLRQSNFCLLNSCW